MDELQHSPSPMAVADRPASKFAMILSRSSLSRILSQVYIDKDYSPSMQAIRPTRSLIRSSNRLYEGTWRYVGFIHILLYAER